MLREIQVYNYRSIRNATIKLSPFTLLIGANGTGKSNLLKLLRDLSEPSGHSQSDASLDKKFYYSEIEKQKHITYPLEEQAFLIRSDKDDFYISEGVSEVNSGTIYERELKDVKIFSLNPQAAGSGETLTLSPKVEEDGQGIVRVLDSLKTGDREDLFHKIETILKTHVPEIEKLSFVPGNLTKSLQVRENNIPKPVAVSDLSEGTQLALQIITILHQEQKPSLICIEDIDKGLHPRLFQNIVQLCFDLTAEDDSIQIIATTHNPYLIDEFKGHESAVVIVEKTNGETTFTTLEEKLQNLDPGEEPLGSLWYSGFVGGVPKGV